MNKAGGKMLLLACRSAVLQLDLQVLTTRDALAAGKLLRYTRNQAAPNGGAIPGSESDGRVTRQALALDGASCN